MYTTAELAKLIGITKNTLLRWEAEGLIPCADRDGRGWRVWSKDSFERVLEIKKAKGLIKKPLQHGKRLKINIIGYGNQARAWAGNLKDSGADVNILLRKGSGSARLASNDGFEVMSIDSSINKPSVFCVLIPDEKHLEFFDKYSSRIDPGSLFIFAHGFSVAYQGLKLNARKALLAPKAIAKLVRKRFLESKTVMAVVDIENERDKKAVENIADMLGFFPLVKASFEQETYSDLLSEQVLLCGGVPALIVKTFNILKQKGIPGEIAVAECLYELSYIIEVIKEKGIAGMYEAISPVAFAGGRKVWDDLSENMDINSVFGNSIQGIESGEFLERLGSFNKKKEINKIRQLSKDFDLALNNCNFF